MQIIVPRSAQMKKSMLLKSMNLEVGSQHNYFNINFSDTVLQLTCHFVVQF